MNNHSIIFIGLDTHKESTEVAYSLDSREHSVYEAGPCGYWVYRLLTKLDYPVIHP